MDIGVCVPQEFSFQTPDSRLLKQGRCAFKNHSEYSQATVSDSTSPEFGLQDVSLPMRPHKVVSHGKRDVLSQVAGSRHRWRDIELEKGFLKSPCKLKNLGTNNKYSGLSVSASLVVSILILQFGQNPTSAL